MFMDCSSWNRSLPAAEGGKRHAGRPNVKDPIPAAHSCNRRAAQGRTCVGQLQRHARVAVLVQRTHRPSQAAMEVTQQAALRADVHFECVAADHQPLHNQRAGAIAYQAVALHLAQPQPAVAAAPLGGLARQHHPRAASSGVHLVQHLLAARGQGLSTLSARQRRGRLRRARRVAAQGGRRGCGAMCLSFW